MLMFHTDNYHIGGEKFQVKTDDGHCEFSCTVCLDDEDVAEWMMMGIVKSLAAACLDEEDVLCSTG